MPQHIHKYHKVDKGRKKPYWVMSCHGSQCNHYHPMKTKLSAPDLVGKLSASNKRGKPFELDRRATRQAYPTCDSCVKSPPLKVPSAEDFFAKLEANLMGDLDDVK